MARWPRSSCKNSAASIPLILEITKTDCGGLKRRKTAVADGAPHLDGWGYSPLEQINTRTAKLCRLGILNGCRHDTKRLS
jgi:hypothetical protein